MPAERRLELHMDMQQERAARACSMEKQKQDVLIEHAARTCCMNMQ
jgi:hypothetical protein